MRGGALFIRAALFDEPLIVHGDGEQSRDFTYIDNVVQANLLACTASGVAASLQRACNSRHSYWIAARREAARPSAQIEHTPRAGTSAIHSIH